MHPKIAQNLAKIYLSKLDKEGAPSADKWAVRTLSCPVETGEVAEQIRLLRAEAPPPRTA